MTARRVELDYVARPYRSPWPGVAVLAVALLLGTHLAYRFTDVQRETAALTETQGLLNNARPARPVSRERAEDEAKQVDAVLRQLTLPWGPMMEAVEGSAVNGVVLLQMQPDAQQYVLRLTAEATSPDVMLEYVRRMSESKLLSDVHLVNHQTQAEDPAHRVQFTVQAGFKGTPK